MLSGLLLTGCMSTPEVVVTAEPDPPPRHRFDEVGVEPISDRVELETRSAALAEANRVWLDEKSATSDYLGSGRLLRSELKRHNYRNAEEQMRLAVMCIQHALLADDVETLRFAAKEWEAAYPGVRSAPRAGEVETYIMAALRLRYEVPSDLLSVAHPVVRALASNE